MDFGYEAIECYCQIETCLRLQQPDNCDGTYDSYCDDSRAYTNITAILRASGHTTLLNWMQTYWTSNQGTAESFWEHEWGKHGTCISTLDPNCYTNYEPTEEVPDFFERVVSLFKSLPSYDWLKAAGITPSTTKTYTRAEIQTALSQHHDGMKVYLGCSSGELDEIWYYFNVRGSLQTGTFVPSKDIGGASSCPDTGIKYLPKSSSGGSPTTTAQSTGTTTSASTSTAAPFEGKGYLNVIQSDGTQNGCLISHGTWYTTGTCATYTATSEPGNKFTLTSSKGLCEVQADGEFYCGADVTKATNFRAQGAELVVHGKTAFYADKVSTGQDQEVVYAKAQGHGVEITVEWEAR